MNTVAFFLLVALLVAALQWQSRRHVDPTTGRRTSADRSAARVQSSSGGFVPGAASALPDRDFQRLQEELAWARGRAGSGQSGRSDRSGRSADRKAPIREARSLEAGHQRLAA